MTPEQIAEARRLIAAATPGPWDDISSGEYGGHIDINNAEHMFTESDNLFVCAARTGWPQALDMVEYWMCVADTNSDYSEKMREENESLRQERDRLAKNHPNAVLMLANDNLRAREKLLVEALEFYADESKWFPTIRVNGQFGPIVYYMENDFGARARAALAERGDG